MDLVRIKPVIDHESRCPHCQTPLTGYQLLWQGIHVCVASTCSGCGAEIVEDLPVGHSALVPYVVEPACDRLWGDELSKAWYGLPLLRALQSPDPNPEVKLTVESFRPSANVIILNCLDYLYGHSLLKLLNAAGHLSEPPDLGLVVMVQSFLRWMVPDGVAEVWVVDLPLSKAQHYYPHLDERIQKECARFETIYLSLALPHPADFDITSFTRVEKHNFDSSRWRITYIWREDRPWWNPPLGYMVPLQWARALRLKQLVLMWQNWKVRRLFRRLRRRFPAATFTVAGLGTATAFPAWIEDRRTGHFTADIEVSMCRVYAESRLVIGVHGSSMLLPSAHAGMTVDLMPDGRWGNMAQDILYQPNDLVGDDKRLLSWRYRYIPMRTPVRTLARIIKYQLGNLRQAVLRFRAEEGLS